MKYLFQLSATRKAVQSQMDFKRFFDFYTLYTNYFMEFNIIKWPIFEDFMIFNYSVMLYLHKIFLDLKFFFSLFNGKKVFFFIKWNNI